MRQKLDFIELKIGGSGRVIRWIGGKDGYLWVGHTHKECYGYQSGKGKLRKFFLAVSKLTMTHPQEGRG